MKAADLPIGSIIALRTHAWIKYEDDAWFATGQDDERDDEEPQRALDSGAQVVQVGER